MVREDHPLRGDQGFHSGLVLQVDLVAPLLLGFLWVLVRLCLPALPGDLGVQCFLVHRPGLALHLGHLLQVYQLLPWHPGEGKRLVGNKSKRLVGNKGKTLVCNNSKRLVASNTQKQVGPVMCLLNSTFTQNIAQRRQTGWK